MKTLKEVLNQDTTSKSQGELFDLITQLEAILGEDYGKVTTLSNAELVNASPKELQDLLDRLKESYSTAWEGRLQNASTELMNAVLQQMDADRTTFRATNASNANFASELGNIDFEKLIGGPLNACVTAQNNASVSTANFIKEVGFVDKDGVKELRMVDFSHEKEIANPNLGKNADDLPDGTDVTSPTIKQQVKLTVPFVSILNIPSLRIETCEIDFNVKLNSVFSKQVNDSFGINAEASGGFGPVKFKVSASYKRSSATGVKVEKEYSMGVKVRATNDAIPAGLEKVLGIISE